MQIIQTEMLIVGSGGAGMMAAMKGAKSGISCVLLEKGKSVASSNAARAGGPALANTRRQEQENATVTVEKLFSHMYEFTGGTVNAALLHGAIEKGREVEEMLDEAGIEMELVPDAYGVGFRARQVFKTNGIARWEPLLDKFQQYGGTAYFHCKAEKAVIQKDGLISVSALDTETGEELRIDANVLIIATGGYLGSRELMQKHFGDIEVVPLGSTLSDGSGIRMAKELGGYEDRNWGICANEFGGANTKSSRRFCANTRYAVCGGLLVNRHGRRFVNEQLLSDKALSSGGEATLREGLFYAVLDEKMYQSLKSCSVFDYYGRPENWYAGKMAHQEKPPTAEDDLEKQIKEGWAYTGSLEQIAQDAHLPELVETVKQYNLICGKGEDPVFGKASYLLKPLTDAPYYVFEYQPSAWCTYGGVKTDEFCRLLDRREMPIRGVYVAGIDNGSCFTAPYYDNEGAALGISMTTGVVAAEHAVTYLKYHPDDTYTVVSLPRYEEE